MGYSPWGHKELDLTERSLIKECDLYNSHIKHVSIKHYSPLFLLFSFGNQTLKQNFSYLDFIIHGNCFLLLVRELNLARNNLIDC